MTTAAFFRALMIERRQFQRGTPDYDYRTRAARTLVWLLRGIPANQWSLQ